MGKPHDVKRRDRRFTVNLKLKNQNLKSWHRLRRFFNFQFCIFHFEFAAKRRSIPWEVKHFSTRRSRNQQVLRQQRRANAQKPKPKHHMECDAEKHKTQTTQKTKQNTKHSKLHKRFFVCALRNCALFGLLDIVFWRVSIIAFRVMLRGSKLEAS